MASRKHVTKSLSGVGNKAYHQYIISDLIFGVRRKLAAAKKASKLSVLSEITLSQIGYEFTKAHFSKDHNIDFVVLNETTKDLLFIAEIEREGASISGTLKKMEECLRCILTIQEAYIIKFDEAGTVSFELCTLENNKLKRTKVNSKSNYLGLSLKRCMLSTRL